MAFYLKNSLCLGPLRFNLSGSGIGLSAGVKGFRVALSCVVIITLFSTTLRSAETGSDPKAQVADVPIKAGAEVTAEAEAGKADEPGGALSSVEIARRLRRIGNSWVLNGRDREEFSFAITNQWQGKVCAGPTVRELSALGLLVEHESCEFWCSFPNWMRRSVPHTAQQCVTATDSVGATTRLGYRVSDWTFLFLLRALLA